MWPGVSCVTNSLIVWAAHHIMCPNSDTARCYRVHWQVIQWNLHPILPFTKYNTIGVSIDTIFSEICSLSRYKILLSVLLTCTKSNNITKTDDHLPDQHDWHHQLASDACWVCNFQAALRAASERSIRLWRHPENVHLAEAAGYPGWGWLPGPCLVNVRLQEPVQLPQLRLRALQRELWHLQSQERHLHAASHLLSPARPRHSYLGCCMERSFHGKAYTRQNVQTHEYHVDMNAVLLHHPFVLLYIIEYNWLPV